MVPKLFDRPRLGRGTGGRVTRAKPQSRKVLRIKKLKILLFLCGSAPLREKFRSAPLGLIFLHPLTAALSRQRYHSASTFCGSALSLRAHANEMRKNRPSKFRSAPLGLLFLHPLTAALSRQRHLHRNTSFSFSKLPQSNPAFPIPWRPPRLGGSVICHLSSVICHLSSVLCHLSSVLCHLRPSCPSAVKLF